MTTENHIDDMKTMLSMTSETVGSDMLQAIVRKSSISGGLQHDK